MGKPLHDSEIMRPCRVSARKTINESCMLFRAGRAQEGLESRGIGRASPSRSHVRLDGDFRNVFVVVSV